jgi:RNA polymerase sigma-70 factor (ECF subfamily)
VNSNRAETDSEPDAALIDRFLGGEIAAFERLIERYEGPLLRFVARYSTHGDSDGAQDIVQEVFVRLLREREGLRELRSLSAWLYRVARNIAIDEARKDERRMERERAVAVPERQSSRANTLETREAAGIVAEKLRGLPEKQRDVLILKIQEEKSYREISEITGLTTSYVGYLIHEGLKTLARELRTAGAL